jgi:hypothetical protein
MSQLNKNDETVIYIIILAIIIILFISHFSKIPSLKMLLYTSLGRVVLLITLI